MALAKLGSERVALIKKGNLELPSDLEGIIRLEFNTNVKEIATKIAQRIAGAGIPVDQRKVIEASQ
jgi:predicted nucleotide-binding protein